MIKAIGYIRASKKEQALSPEAQRAALEAFASREGLFLTAIFTDAASGGLPLEKRAGLVAALDELKLTKASALLVAKRDRLARDVLNAAMIERVVEKQGARILSAAGEGNGSSPEAMMLRGIMDVFAQYERALIRFRTSAALQVKKNRGERVGRIPFGCQLAADGKTLEPCPPEMKLLIHMHELQASGLSLRGIAGILERAGVRNREGRPFSHVSIAGLLNRKEGEAV